MVSRPYCYHAPPGHLYPSPLPPDYLFPIPGAADRAGCPGDHQPGRRPARNPDTRAAAVLGRCVPSRTVGRSGPGDRSPGRRREGSQDHRCHRPAAARVRPRIVRNTGRAGSRQMTPDLACSICRVFARFRTFSHADFCSITAWSECPRLARVDRYVRRYTEPHPGQAGGIRGT